jgi:hypothetical protein
MLGVAAATNGTPRRTLWQPHDLFEINVQSAAELQLQATNGRWSGMTLDDERRGGIGERRPPRLPAWRTTSSSSRRQTTAVQRVGGSGVWRPPRLPTCGRRALAPADGGQHTPRECDWDAPIMRSSPDAAGSKDNRNPNRGVASGVDSKLSASTAVTGKRSRVKTLSLGLFCLTTPELTESAKQATTVCPSPILQIKSK